MSTITVKRYSGGAKLTPKSPEEGLAEDMRDVADDLAALRAAIVGITAKLDADAGVTDTDYAATWDPAALTHIKG